MATDFATKYVQNYLAKGGDKTLADGVLKLLNQTPEEAKAAAAQEKSLKSKASASAPISDKQRLILIISKKSNLSKDILSRLISDSTEEELLKMANMTKDQLKNLIDILQTPAPVQENNTVTNVLFSGAPLTNGINAITNYLGLATH